MSRRTVLLVRTLLVLSLVVLLLVVLSLSWPGVGSSNFERIEYRDQATTLASIQLAARFAIIATTAFGWPRGTVGITDASATQSPSTP